MAAAACSSESSNPGRFLPPTPEVTSQRVTNHALDDRWGEIGRWQIEGANWSIELPQQGRWDSGNPLNEAGFSADAVTYRSDDGTLSGPDPSLFVDILRLELNTLSEPTCASPTLFIPGGVPISGSLGNIPIDGYDASLSRLTLPADDGSTTGTFQVCFVTSEAMYQLAAAARPGDAQADLLTMLQTFTLSD